MTSNFVDVLGHQLHYLEWKSEAVSAGATAALTVVMVHGLTRTAHDFAHIGEYLASNGSVRAISFDVIGRGLSSWASPTKTPAEATKEDYNIPHYIQLFKAALPKIGITGEGDSKCAWIGTSMGGLIGFVGYGSGELRPFIHTMVLNDIGPHVPRSSLKGIYEYTLHTPKGDTYPQFEEALRASMAGFGDIPPSLFRSMTKPFARRDAQTGAFTVHYDERILDAIRSMFESEPTESDAALGTANSDGAEAVLWALMGNVDVPVLLFNGDTSKVLLKETAERMMNQPQQTRERRLITVSNCGHAPMLFEEDHLVALRSFLESSLQSR
jgi:pimeloyl-ACP methyl ester carboxylesterase